jgi:hypothetical protein
MDVVGQVRAWLGRVAPRERLLFGAFAAYFTVCVLPLLHRRSVVAPAAFALLLPPPLLLAYGLKLVAKFRAMAAYVLLAAVPAALVLPVCALSHEVALTTFSGAGLGLGLLSFVGYVAAAASVCSDGEPLYPCEHRPLSRTSRSEPHSSQRLGERVLIAVAVMVSVAVVVGASGTPMHYRAAFRDAAPEGAALTGIVAGVVASLAIVLLGPFLRAARATDPREQSRLLRLLPAVLWMASGATLYVLSRP